MLHALISSFSTLFPHSSFSTLLIFYTPHFPHSSFSTLCIFYTPHFLHSAFSTALRTPRFPPNPNLSIHGRKIMAFSSPFSKFRATLLLCMRTSSEWHRTPTTTTFYYGTVFPYQYISYLKKEYNFFEIYVGCP